MLLDKKAIKHELRSRGMTLGMWAKARGVEYAALIRVLQDMAGKEITEKILALLKKDGLLFELSEAYLPQSTMQQAVFWSFLDASRYLGIPVSRLRQWEKTGASGFPRAIRLGESTILLLKREAIQEWAENILARQGELPKKEAGV